MYDHYENAKEVSRNLLYSFLKFKLASFRFKIFSNIPRVLPVPAQVKYD